MIQKIELRGVIIGINPVNGTGRPMFVRMHDVRPGTDISRGTLHLRADLDTGNALIGTVKRNVLSYQSDDSADMGRLSGFLRNEHMHGRLGHLMRVRSGENTPEEYVRAAMGRIALPITDNFAEKPFDPRKLYELRIDGSIIETAPLPPDSRLGNIFSALGRTILLPSADARTVDKQARTCLGELQKAVSNSNITPARAVVLCSILECAQRKLQVLDKDLGLLLNGNIQPLKTAIVDASRVLPAAGHEEITVTEADTLDRATHDRAEESTVTAKQAEEDPTGRVMTEEDVFDPGRSDLDLWTDIFSGDDLEELIRTFPEFASCRERPFPERPLLTVAHTSQEPEQVTLATAPEIERTAAPARIMTEKDLFDADESDGLDLWMAYLSAEADKKDLRQLIKDFPEFKPSREKKIPVQSLQALPPLIEEETKPTPARTRLKRGHQQKLFSAAAELPKTFLPEEPQTEVKKQTPLQTALQFKAPGLSYETTEPSPKLAAMIAGEPVLGGRIRILRENEGLTPTEFVNLINEGTDRNTGLKFNLSTSTYSYVERRDTPPHARYLYRMCEIFRKGAEWVLYGKGFRAAIAELAENEKIYFLMMRKGMTEELLSDTMKNKVSRFAINYWINGKSFPEGDTRQALWDALEYPDIYRNSTHAYPGRTSYDERLLAALKRLAKALKPFTIELLASEAGVSPGRARAFHVKYPSLFIERSSSQEDGRQ